MIAFLFLIARIINEIIKDIKLKHNITIKIARYVLNSDKDNPSKVFVEFARLTKFEIFAKAIMNLTIASILIKLKPIIIKKHSFFLVKRNSLFKKKRM